MPIRLLVKTKEVQELLSGLQQQSPEIDSAALISQDGILLASTLQDEAEKERFSLMLASFLSLGAHMSANLKIGKLQQALIKVEQGSIILLSVKDKGVLSCLVSGKTNLGWTLLQMKRTAEKLAPYVHPIAYGTALLNPEVLLEYERKTFESEAES